MIRVCERTRMTLLLLLLGTACGDDDSCQPTSGTGGAAGVGGGASGAATSGGSSGTGVGGLGGGSPSGNGGASSGTGGLIEDGGGTGGIDHDAHADSPSPDGNGGAFMDGRTEGSGGSSGSTGSGGTSSDASSQNCPAMQPGSNVTCNSTSGYCYYGGVICSCDPQGGFQLDGGPRYSWNCGNGPVGCPAMVPTDGSQCATLNQRCSYDFRPCSRTNPSYFICLNGVWKIMETPCS